MHSICCILAILVCSSIWFDFFMQQSAVPPSLSQYNTSILEQSRFQQPEGWRWHFFRNARGMKIRFGSVFPKDSIPDAIVVVLPGLSEFGEKYFELARDMLSRNLAFWVIDWAGQGESDRYINGSQKRHAGSYDDDIQDLHQLIQDYIKPSSVHPDVGRIGRVMIGHSMGAHIGLRYMQKYSNDFMAAAFSAPLLNIKAVDKLPRKVASLLSSCLAPLHRSYVSGYGDWPGKERTTPGSSLFSSDAERDQIHALWQIQRPILQLGHVTYGWVHETLKSCAKISRKTVSSLGTPCYIAYANEEELVSNRAIKKVLSNQPMVTLVSIPDARHEILMEKDAIRDIFLAGFDDLLRKHVLSCEDRVKPF